MSTDTAKQSSTQSFGAIILAAGKGTRMESDKAKVLHEIAGKPMLHYVIRTAQQLQASKTAVVIGHQADQVEKYFSDEKNIHWVMQTNPKGTGDAVSRAKKHFLNFKGSIIVLYGDIPGIRVETIRRLRMMHDAGNHSVSILTADLDDPTGYGRVVVRPDGSVAKIVEHKDATLAEKDITEVNTGIGIYDSDFLWDNINLLKPANKQNELYLTDLVHMAREQKKRVGRMSIKDPLEVTGINDRNALADVSRFFFDEKASHLLERGVSLEDPANITIELDVAIDSDSEIQGEVILRGQTVLGHNCKIKSGSSIVDSHLGNHCHVEESCTLKYVEAGNHVSIGSNSVLGV